MVDGKPGKSTNIRTALEILSKQSVQCSCVRVMWHKRLQTNLSCTSKNSLKTRKTGTWKQGAVGCYLLALNYGYLNLFGKA